MIKVGFSTTDSWVARVIRWFSQARVSHTFLYFTFAGREWVVEAGWSGVNMTTWTRFQALNRVVKLIDLPNAHNIDLGEALDMIGDPYDYPGLVGMIWVSIGRWLHRKWQNPLASSKALFCSEMATILLQRSGYPGAEALIPRDTSPGDLLDFLEQGNL